MKSEPDVVPRFLKEVHKKSCARTLLPLDFFSVFFGSLESIVGVWPTKTIKYVFFLMGKRLKRARKFALFVFFSRHDD